MAAGPDHAPMDPGHRVPSESECAEILRRVRWGEGQAKCVNCGSRKVVREGVSGSTSKYRCKKCGLYFNDKSRTIFQDTKVPLSKWFAAALLVQEDDTITSIAKRIGLSYRNTYYIVKKLGGNPVASRITEALRLAEKERGDLPDPAAGSTAQAGSPLTSS